MELSTRRVFIESAARDFRRTGAVVPSSRALAQAMTAELSRQYCQGASVLEVGAGTGSITEEIVRYLGEGDRLDVCEIDRKFAGIIKKRLKVDPCFRGVTASVRVINRPVEAFTRRPRYDFILSCLPFTNFEPDAVRNIFELYRSLLRPGGICSFYEYILVRKAARLMSGRPEGRRRVGEVGRVVREYIERYAYRHQVVLLNFPPAMVHHIRFPEG
jgi:phosphatidylethanolamine/phosphatidyl-N-methylethanolamine N-methyltransferase